MSKEIVKVKTAKVKDGGEPASTQFEYDFGDNLQHAVSLWGENVVFTLFKAKAEIQVQDLARNALVAGKTPDEAAQLAASHKLGASTVVAKDPVAQGVAALAKMTAEERRNFLLELQKKAAELGG